MNGPHHTHYYITSPEDILDSFGTIEFATNQAWDALMREELLVSGMVNGYQVTFLNPNKELEVTKYFNKDPVKGVIAKLQPPPATFNGLEKRFEIVTENAWPNQGTYYLCTLVGDPASWVALFRSKPNKKATRMNFGSLEDRDSKITKMWKTIHSLGKRELTFYKKQAEDMDQKAFGNNRQPATASFSIFCYLGWLKEVKQHGKTIYYSLDKDNLHDALVSGRAYACHMCAKVYLERYCDNCKTNI